MTGDYTPPSPGTTRAMSVSLGAHALPAVREAISHAAAARTHDPILYLVATGTEQQVRVVCRECGEGITDAALAIDVRKVDKPADNRDPAVVAALLTDGQRRALDALVRSANAGEPGVWCGRSTLTGPPTYGRFEVNTMAADRLAILGLARIVGEMLDCERYAATPRGRLVWRTYNPDQEGTPE
ncbi:MAG: hypothetical protein ACRDQD_01095 [Nocardioidaceae bacterium]